jgi:hypothetical protein
MRMQVLATTTRHRKMTNGDLQPSTCWRPAKAARTIWTSQTWFSTPMKRATSSSRQRLSTTPCHDPHGPHIRDQRPKDRLHFHKDESGRTKPFTAALKHNISFAPADAYPKAGSRILRAAHAVLDPHDAHGLVGSHGCDRSGGLYKPIDDNANAAEIHHPRRVPLVAQQHLSTARFGHLTRPDRTKPFSPSPGREELEAMQPALCADSDSASDSAA